MASPLTLPVRRLAANRRGRDFVVGDLHGNWALLQQALDGVNFRPGRDRLLSVGDIVDRGPQSMPLLELLQTDWFFACLGNHESVLLDYQQQGDEALATHWRQFGGDWFFALSEAQQKKAAWLVQQHCSYALHVEGETGDVGVVHADVPQGVSWTSFCAGVAGNREWQRCCLWSRERTQGLRHDSIPGIRCVVAGHQIVPTVTQIANLWLIDTGAYKGKCDGGALSLFELPKTAHRFT